MKIPFSRAAVVGNEEKYLLETLQSGKWSGRGSRTLEFEKRVRETLGVKHAFFVTSGSAALDVGAVLANLNSGDEVILPSFGFTSTANCVVARGAVPVFADIDPETWNLSVETVRSHVTKNTRAIVTIHYAGSISGIGELRQFCKEKGLFLIEDAAQSLGTKDNGKWVGPTSWVSCFSLHDTKNVGAGEGGLICTDDDEIAWRTEIIIEKGTDRQKFLRGQVDKYSWVDFGSSYVASDLLAAVGLAQFEKLNSITERRRDIFAKYYEALKSFEGSVSFQKLSPEHNGHIFAILLPEGKRDSILSQLNEKGIGATFHFVPLHSSPYARKMGWVPKKPLVNTDRIAAGLIRLPLFWSLREPEVQRVCEVTRQVLRDNL